MITFKEIKSRWRNATPKFFKVLMRISAAVSGTAIAVNEALQLANIEPHEWWTNLCPYLIGVPAGIAFACKFTQTYDNNGKSGTGSVPDGSVSGSRNLGNSK